LILCGERASEIKNVDEIKRQEREDVTQSGKEIRQNILECDGHPGHDLNEGNDDLDWRREVQCLVNLASTVLEFSLLCPAKREQISTVSEDVGHDEKSEKSNPQGNENSGDPAAISCEVAFAATLAGAQP